MVDLRLLVAEDNAVNRQLALALLRRLGYDADVVENGREVLDALERERYDVVLMDVQMPELDGLEATRQIRERRGSSDAPRIIAMTANAMEGDRDACLAAGMDDYLSKPIRPEELAAALAHAGPLGRSRMLVRFPTAEEAMRWASSSLPTIPGSAAATARPASSPASARQCSSSTCSTPSPTRSSSSAAPS